MRNPSCTAAASQIMFGTIECSKIWISYLHFFTSHVKMEVVKSQLDRCDSHATHMVLVAIVVVDDDFVVVVDVDVVVVVVVVVILLLLLMFLMC